MRNYSITPVRLRFKSRAPLGVKLKVGLFGFRFFTLTRLIKPGMGLFKLFGYWNSLRAFFFTFKALDTVVGLFVFRQVAIKGAGGPGIVVDNRIVIIL
jgi:hypothetical protein